MTALKAVLVTAAVVLAAVGATLIAMALIWLIGNYGVDRLLAVLSLVISTVSLLFAIIVSLRSRR